MAHKRHQIKYKSLRIEDKIEAYIAAEEEEEDSNSASINDNDDGGGDISPLVSTSKGKQQDQQQIVHEYDDEDHPHQQLSSDSDECYQLNPSKTKNVFRKKKNLMSSFEIMQSPLNILKNDDEHFYLDEERSSVIGDTCRSIGSALLSLLFFSPVIFYYFHYYNVSDTVDLLNDIPIGGLNMIDLNSQCSGFNASEYVTYFESTLVESITQRHKKQNWCRNIMKTTSSSSSSSFSNRQHNQQQDQQQCHCLSSPIRPTRGVQHMNNRKYYEKWNKQFNKNKQISSSLLSSSSDKISDLIILGDSITEHWQGTDLAEVEPKYEHLPKLFEELQEENDVNAIALGIAGDRISQLLYRIQHGELSPIVQENGSAKPKVIVLLIGTNDISDSCSIEYIIVGVINIIQTIRKQIISNGSTGKVYVVINSILPRPIDPFGSLHNDNMKRKSTWDDILLVNKYLQCYVFSKQKQQHQGTSIGGTRNNDEYLIDFLNTTSIFLIDEDDNDGKRIRKEYMDDWLHPTYEGSKVWGDAIMREVKELINK